MFPTGVKVELERNYWGLDVNVITTRPKDRALESGLCLYDFVTNITTFGETQRSESNLNFYFDLFWMWILLIY